jgi:PleD family two-component response regulator
LQVARRLREEIEAEFAQGRPYQVTVSVGVASLEMCGVTTVDDLIHEADNAEILAKNSGKNRVVAAWLV